MNKEHLTQLRDLFRKFYGNLPIKELSENTDLSQSIERLENLFRKVLSHE